MSSMLQGPEAQDSLFLDDRPPEVIPAELARASLRLNFSPLYVIVGAYRLCTDQKLYIPAWEKCKHGIQRGLTVGGVWAIFTFKIQRKIIELFLINSRRITGLSNDTIFGYKIPFKLSTYATALLLGSQVTFMLNFFLSRNIRIARERAWAQTVASRGKGPEFWQPYVEEWEHPPSVDDSRLGLIEKFFVGRIVGFVIRKVLLTTFHIIPFFGILVSAWFKALGTSRNLHKPYFEAKGMTSRQRLVFVEERKWEYRLFGFTAALLEGVPVIGLLFTVSNRVGAAMWAHDLEKRQHSVAAGEMKHR